jgi:hypothetical protein
MNEKLFELRQLLLFIGIYPENARNQVEDLIFEIGFSSTVYINGFKAFETQNLYSGYFENNTENDVLLIVKEMIYEKCNLKGIGVLDFFLIDATNANMFKSIWHAGIY